jgi:hypothetical protein
MRQVNEAVLQAYLCGANTRRIRRALKPLLQGRAFAGEWGAARRAYTAFLKKWSKGCPGPTVEVLRRHPDARVVLVTVHDDPALVERGRAAGVLGHVLEVAAATDLMPAVHAALRNERYVSSRLRRRPSGR